MNHATATNADSNDDMDNQEHPIETRKNSRMAFYIAFLALFFTAVGITVGYKHWLRIDDKAKSALKEIHIIKQQLSHTADKNKVEQLSANLTQSSNDTEQRLTESLQELDQIREQTTYSAQTVTDQIAELTRQQYNQNNDKPWKKTDSLIQLAEVRFLLESAERRFSMDYDKHSALQFLKAADQILIQMASPEWLSVREKLTQNIAQLERYSSPDLKALTTTIRKLDRDIKPLMELEKKLANGEQVVLFEDINNKSLTGKVKNYINDAISIRKQTTLPRYAPHSSDKERIDQLLRLRIESLRLMAMQRHNQEYHLQIKSIKQMLELYYSVVDAKPWLATLEKLDEEDLTPQRPIISTALDTLLKTPSETATATSTEATKTNQTAIRENRDKRNKK